MKKHLIPLLFIFFITFTASAQIDWRKYSQTYPSGSLQDTTTIALIVQVRQENNSFWTGNNSRSVSDRLLNDSDFMKFRPKNFFAITTFDTSKAQFFVHGINQTNVDQYEFRVSRKGSQAIAPWINMRQRPGLFQMRVPGWPQMAYLGGYITPIGGLLIVDVREKSTGNIVASTGVFWKPIKPILLNIYTSEELSDFLARLQHPDAYHLTAKELNKWKSKYPAAQLDNFTFLPKVLKLNSTENNLIFYLNADIRDRKLIEYQLIKNDAIVTNWKENDFDNSFIWLKSLGPGKYQLRFRYSVQKANIAAYNFIISPEWYQTAIFKLVAAALIIGLAAMLIWIFFLLRQRARSATELLKRERFQSDLQVIRAQLNPHFIFNSLSSIQSLYNSNELTKGNRYLSEFAQLLRNTLVYTNKENTPIAEEIKILDTYLRLEQLRFGFKYEIIIDKDLDIYEYEIPSLLLQPIIENAVKHGVCALGENGIISLNFKAETKAMVVTVLDNGKGFLEEDVKNGFGLKLTKQRIELLNKVLNFKSVILEISKEPNTLFGISLTFKNWFYEEHLPDNR